MDGLKSPAYAPAAACGSRRTFWTLLWLGQLWLRLLLLGRVPLLACPAVRSWSSGPTAEQVSSGTHGDPPSEILRPHLAASFFSGSFFSFPLSERVLPCHAIARHTQVRAAPPRLFPLPRREGLGEGFLTPNYPLDSTAPFIASLEDRRLLAVVTVNTVADSIDFTDGKTSLREAIFATNTVPGADESTSTRPYSPRFAHASC